MTNGTEENRVQERAEESDFRTWGGGLAHDTQLVSMNRGHSSGGRVLV